MKQAARAFPIPQAVTQENVEEQVIVDDDTEVSPFQNASPEEAKMADAITSEIYMYIYRDGWDDIVEELQKSKGNLAEKVGEIAGNLLSNEMLMAEEEGMDVSRDMYLDMQSGVVHQLTEVVAEKDIKRFKDDNEAQAFMGEAMTYAINANINSEDSKITEESWLELTKDMLRGGVDPQPRQVSGARVIEEVV
jgi:hypothetical protein